MEEQNISNLSSIIQNNYIEIKKYYEDLVKSDRYKTLLKELEKVQQDDVITLDQQIQSTVIDIKTAKLQNFKQTTSTIISQKQALELKAKWDKLKQKLLNENYADLNKELEILEQYMINLDNLLKQNIDINMAQVIMPKTPGAIESSYTIQSRLEGLLSRIQGKVLEQEIQRALIKILPTDIEAFSTGSFLGSQNRQIKQDISLFLKNQDKQNIFQIKGQNISKLINLNQTIVLNDLEIQSLEDSSLGVSVKSTAGRITFQSGANINQLLKDAETVSSKKEQNQYIKPLQHWYELKLAQQDMKIVDIYQRFATSKIAINIIGKNNVFMASTKNIVPTYKYIQDSILSKSKRGLYFSNKAQTASSTSILGPALRKY